MQPLIDQLPQDLSPAHRERVVQLLRDNSDIFSWHKFDLKCTDLIGVRIPTGDAQPYAEGLRSQPRAYLQAIDDEIAQLLKADVIEPANSSWISNIVCVKKNNGDLIQAEISIRKLPDGNYMGSVRDITEDLQHQQEKEDLLKQVMTSQKMEAVGRLARGLVHDFNNSLASIIGYSEFLVQDLLLHHSLEHGLLHLWRFCCPIFKSLMA